MLGVTVHELIYLMHIISNGVERAEFAASI